MEERGRFQLGLTVITPRAREALEEADVSPAYLLLRHSLGDWGDVDPDDWEANERALDQETRLISVYSISEDVRVWVITEADRSSTCILLPSEY